MNSKILIPVVVALVVGAGGFFAGMQYQKRKVPALGDFQNMRGLFGQGTRAQISEIPLQNQGRPVSGEIIAQDEESITVKLTDGSSRIVFVSESAKINKLISSVKDDLVEGMQVFVTGNENSDGSMTASLLQIIPTQGE